MSPLPPITTIFVFLSMRLLLSVLVFIFAFGSFVIRSLLQKAFSGRSELVQGDERNRLPCPAAHSRLRNLDVNSKAGG